MDDIKKLKSCLLAYLLEVATETDRYGKRCCPVCGSGTGKNSKGKGDSAFSVAPDGLSWYCHSCHGKGDVVDLYQAINNCDKGTAIEALKKRYLLNGDPFVPVSLPKVPLKDNDVERQKRLYTIEQSQAVYEGSRGDAYMRERGISTETAKRFGIGFSPYLKRVIIPTADGSYIGRDVTGEQAVKALAQGKRHLFNGEALTTADYCFIVEAEIDALSILEIGAVACGIGGTSNIQKVVDANPTAFLLLALDNDAAGRKAQSKLAELLTMKGIRFTEINTESLYLNTKDANESLCADRNGFAERLMDGVEAFKRYRESEMWDIPPEVDLQAETTEPMMRPIIDRLQVVYERMMSASNAVSTGIDELDGILPRHGLLKGLYLLGAEPGSGKSALCLQVADNVAKRGHNVLYLSFEMAEEELLLRSMMRQCAERGEKRSSVQVERAFLDGYLLPDEDVASHFYAETFEDMKPTLENVAKVVSQFVQMNTDEECLPLVIIDFLQLIQVEDAKLNADTTMRLHTIAYALKSMSRDCPFLVISSLNREGRKKDKPTLESLLGSGSLEYSANWVGIIRKREEDGIYPDREKPLAIHCIKARSGRSDGIADLNFIGEEMRFVTPQKLVFKPTEDLAKDTTTKRKKWSY